MADANSGVRTMKRNNRQKGCHKHECKHERVEFCGECKKVHCLACKQEWEEPQAPTFTPQPYPVPYPVYPRPYWARQLDWTIGWGTTTASPTFGGASTSLLGSAVGSSPGFASSRTQCIDICPHGTVQ